jgi:hypothetical protein
LKTQNYDKGFDRFVRTFDPEEEMSATVAVIQGCHRDHGWAVYCTQDPRRCLLLDTVCGLTGDQALWMAMGAWATFQPRKASPRDEPGRLFDQIEASHVFEKYWNYLPCPGQHPDFASESPYCQQQMTQFSQALAEMNLDPFVPKSAAEAKESDLRTSEDAAPSRLLPIQDGPDQWEICRSSRRTGSGRPPPI